MARLKRIGLITPTVNLAIEPDFYSVAPKGVAIHAERMLFYESKVKGGDPRDLEKGNEDVERAARYLKGLDLDLIAYACTAGTFHTGRWDYDEQIGTFIEKTSGVPCVTALHASVEALNRVKAKKISVVGPYGDQLLARLTSLLEKKGFEVLSAEGEPAMKQRINPVVISNQDPQVILGFVPKAIKAGSDTIYLPGSAWRALEVVEELEKKTGKTVITVNQGIIWSALREVGISEPINGFGKLLTMVP